MTDVHPTTTTTNICLAELVNFGIHAAVVQKSEGFPLLPSSDLVMAGELRASFGMMCLCPDLGCNFADVAGSIHMTGEQSVEEDSDSQSSPPESLTNDDSDNEPMEDIQEEVDYLPPNENNVEKGSFLLVKVLGGSRKKTNYRNVAMVQNISEDEIEVLGMKSLVEGKKIFKLWRMIYSQLTSST
ncbi:unnamed protein product [Psylliodes chrysocephalus]|uniref:Uncharacterized protein n=1 Tax=Psylliodes chrysocephalus TaxID=3402493 RepID=A0A9P0D5U7_9CUCU|nr:unnamed protein product [Psylliodes chrysocephala]